MFFKLLKLMNWFTAQCRQQFYNVAFGTKFRYFGKGCSVDISGQVKIGNNVYIGDHVSLIVEKGAVLEIADNSFIGENCYIKCFGGKVVLDMAQVSAVRRQLPILSARRTDIYEIRKK